jgi:hypothetical protein
VQKPIENAWLRMETQKLCFESNIFMEGEEPCVLKKIIYEIPMDIQPPGAGMYAIGHYLGRNKSRNLRRIQLGFFERLGD